MTSQYTANKFGNTYGSCKKILKLVHPLTPTPFFREFVRFGSSHFPQHVRFRLTLFIQLVLAPPTTVGSRGGIDRQVEPQVQ